MMQKVYPRFALGLRFTVSEDCGAEACWNQVFTRLPASLMEGLSLYTCEPPLGEMHPERTCLCVIANLHLSRCKTLYAYVSADVFLCAYLAQLHPFVQNNYLERCRNSTFLGNIDADGVVSGGDVSIGVMRFTGEKVRRPAKRARCLLALGGGVARSNAESVRLFARTLGRLYPACAVMPFPIPDGSRGTSAALLSLCGGRYSSCNAHDAVGKRVTASYAVLPDETAVIEYPEHAPEGEPEASREGTFGVGEQILHACRAGSRSFILALRGEPLPDGGEGLLRVLQTDTGELADARLAECVFCIYTDDPAIVQRVSNRVTVEHASLLAHTLEKARFLNRLRSAESVITDQPEVLPDGTQSPLYALCKGKNVPVRTFERPDTETPVSGSEWMSAAENALWIWHKAYGGQAQ